MLLALAQITLDEKVSIGNIITLLLVCAIFLYVYLQTKKDMSLVTIQNWIDKHERESEKKELASESRLRATENAVIQLTAIQETMRDHLNAIDRRHERVDNNA